MKLSSYLPWRRVQLVWSEGGITISRSNVKVWHAWALIPFLHFWCFVDAMSVRKPVRGKAKFVEITLDKRRE